MSKILSPELSALVLAAIEMILLGNNGYADIGVNPEVAEAVRAAGFIVIASKNLHGAFVYKGFTKASQESLASAPYGVSLYKPIVQRDDFDYEGAILARQERFMEGF